MKQIKKGFSLAEVLIAMGIVSVIATIGFTVGRRGVETAYNQYIYTGYKGISIAIANAVQEGLDIEGMSDASTGGTPANRFVENVIDTLNGRIVDYVANNHVIFDTPNGTRFEIAGNAGMQGATVTMTVPAKKRRGRASETICLDYLPHRSYGGILIPVQSGASCVSTIDNISARKDLLPFYIDNGTVGRVLPIGQRNADGDAVVDKQYNFVPRNYYSIQEALCRAYGNGIYHNINGEIIVNCNVIGPFDSEQGAIKVMNPRKIY